jgi:hypothetical protein
MALFLYTLLLVFLAILQALIDRRVARLERKYARAAREVDRLAREPLYKGGNTTRPDPTVAAKRQYQLGLLAQRRDRLEAKHESWQTARDKVAALAGRIRAWKGRKLPYTLGILDFGFVLYLIDTFGLGQVNVRGLIDEVATLLSR